MHSPKTVDISITTSCNLRCKYCSHFTSASDVSADLPFEEWLRFFEELNRAAVLSVTIEGGEPFFRKDIKKIIEGIVRNRMRFSILSNGTLITDEMAAFLASTKRCDSVQVSIDGSIPFTHDAMRGEGNFRKAVNGLLALRRNNVRATVRVTIHRKNVDDLEHIAKFLLEDIGLSGFGTNSACYMGICRKNADEVQLTTEERTRAMKILLQLDKKYPGRISAMAGPLAEARMWLKMEEARRKREAIPGRGRLVGCGGSWSKIAVRPDGVYVPCLMISHIELGRINYNPLIDIWQNHEELKKLRERRQISLSEFPYCKDCAYIDLCSGSCPALAYTYLGQVHHPSPDACLKRFLEEGGRLPDESLMTSVKC
ncbi:MAG: SynChlorMet cassette radical SAM/SPASM protein ScmE [Candidatus Omnitrophica bacterium]|nr:SynChlorMet cassette radical SAM/SPASM protein ScmE [Candidatus Omnitrophota bacterium]